jgi:hypothetical protein
MSDFHKWRREYQREIWDSTPLTEIRWSLADMELCWNAATAAERERCISRIPFGIDAIVTDLTDRRGLKQEWQQIKSEIVDGICQSWERCVIAAIREQEVEDE